VAAGKARSPTPFSGIDIEYMAQWTCRLHRLVRPFSGDMSLERRDTYRLHSCHDGLSRVRMPVRALSLGYARTYTI